MPREFNALGYRLIGCGARRLYLSDDGQYVRSERASRLLVRRNALGTGLGQISRVTRLSRPGRSTCDRRSTPAPFLQARIDMEHKRIGIGARLTHEKPDLVSHHAGDKGHVARQAAEFRHHNRRLAFASGSQRGAQLGTTL
jgi:hypothetical protein